MANKDIINRSVPIAGADRAIISPGVLVFSPHFVKSNNAGEYIGVVCIKSGANYKIQTVWTDDDFGSVIFSDDILATVGTDYFDPWLLKLPNNDIILGFHSGSGTLYFYKSVDGGRTWTQISTLAPTAGHSFSEVCIIRLRQPGTGTANRILCAFVDVDPTKTRDTYIVTMYSDNECAIWSAQTIVTPTSGSSSCAQLSDNLRAFIFEDISANIQLVYTRKALGVPAEVWAENLNNVGQAPSGSPSKIAIAALAMSTTGTPQNGVSPIAIRNRDGFYSLFFTAADYGLGGNSGELHMLRGNGQKNGWTGDTIILSAIGVPNGWGRVTPHRTETGFELFYVSVTGPSVSHIRSLSFING